MIEKCLEDITGDDLASLISGGVAEGRTIEYKRQLPGNSDADKKEFLADASSFANTSGGDLIFGMDESHGLPTQVVGLQSGDLDLEIRRLDSILSSGLDPRIRYRSMLVACAGDQRVLFVRVEHSWFGPHRVIFKGHDKFYARNSGGKYSLDVNELRTAFTLSETVIQRIRAFRTDRIIALSNNQAPVPFMATPKIVLHCIPIQAFTGGASHDVISLYDEPLRLKPMIATTWDRRLNLDGIITFGGTGPSYSYTQVYRTGIIETVQGRLLASVSGTIHVIPSASYEMHLREYLSYCLGLLQELGASTPVLVALSFVQVRGLQLAVERGGYPEYGEPIATDTLILPETVVEDFSMSIDKILRPLFDLVWNASGYARSLNFDANGAWIGPTTRR
jgi:Putative DNA-binding domain